MADVQIENHGSVYLFRPLTAEAEEWLSEHVSPDATYWGESLVVEHRYAHDLADGMSSDGLEVI